MSTGIVFLALVLLAVFWRPGEVFSHTETGGIETAGERPEVVSPPRAALTELQSFRMAILPVSIFIYVFGVPLAVLTVAILERTTSGLLFHTCIFAVIGLPVWWLPCSMRGCIRIMADSSGLNGYSAFCPHRYLAWADIEVVGPIRILSLRYLRLRSISSGKRMWLPLFLKKQEGFRECVAAFAPGHAMLRYL